MWAGTSLAMCVGCAGPRPCQPRQGMAHEISRDGPGTAGPAFAGMAHFTSIGSPMGLKQVPMIGASLHVDIAYSGPANP